MLHGQVSKEPFPDRDAALPERPNAAEHPLSGWAINALRKAGIRTVGELADRSADELLDLPNFGADSLRRTETFLARRGLALSGTHGAGPSPRGAPAQGTAPLRIDPGVEERLRSAGLWEGPAPGRLAPGARLHDLLRAPALEEDGYDGATARAALEEISALVELLRPYVEGRGGSGPGQGVAGAARGGGPNGKGEVRR